MGHRKLKKLDKLGVMVNVCNLSNQETEAGGFQVWGQPELHSVTLSGKKKKLDSLFGTNLILIMPQTL
jgi:hypothetical protein